MFDSASLKAKRHVIKALLAGLRTNFQVAAAEVEYQDLWQRAAIGVSCVAESAAHAKRVLHQIQRHVEKDTRIELLDVATDVMSTDDE